MNKPLDYRQAGVDIDAASKALDQAKKHIKSTHTERVLGRYGTFSGLFDLKGLGNDPVLVASTDGVGTKLKLAFKTGIHNTIGQDLVNHCVDDIVCCGARPLFFLDYLGTGKLEGDAFEQIVAGLAKACRENNTVLLGGETAEMPGLYQAGEYDLASTIVGVVERNNIIDGSRIAPGHCVIGLPSTGLHTNGFSLAQKALFDVAGMDPLAVPKGFLKPLAEELLAIHRSYGVLVHELLAAFDICGIVHITGGGFQGNTPRILPEGVKVEIDSTAWEVPPIFKLIRQAGNIETPEMYRVFNMGIGMLLFCPQEHAQKVITHCRNKDCQALQVGCCSENDSGEKLVMKY